MNERIAAVPRNRPHRKGLNRTGTETGASGASPYPFPSHLEDVPRTTNLEEILGAAHAACFTMAFSFACDRAGRPTRYIDTQAIVRLPRKDDGSLVDRIMLTMHASVPGITEAAFHEIASATKRGYPLSKALGIGPDITLEATLLP